MKSNISAKDKEYLQAVKLVSEIFNRSGISVRRENLSRGHLFRVKSGRCFLSGSNVLFVDRRLAPEQQLSLLSEFLMESGLSSNISQGDLDHLPQSARQVMSQSGIVVG